MAFTLRWKNENPAGSVVKVYRSPTPLNPSSLPEPIATLSNGEESYTDTNVVIDAGYYYLLTVTVEGRTVTGPSKYIVVKNRRGVGSVDLVHYGDTDDLAHLGQLTYADSIPYDSLPAGFRALTGLAGQDRVVFSKFLRYGKVYYLPLYGKITSIPFSWDAVYSAGLMYGVDGPGPENGRGTLEAVNQNGLFEWQGDTYRMRCMRGLSDLDEPTVMSLPDSLNGVSHDTLPNGRCEYNDLVYPLCQWVPEKQQIGNWLFYTTQALMTASSTAGGYLCQERDPDTGKVLMRGASTTTVGTRADLTKLQTTLSSNAIGLFAPIIELME